MSGYILLMLVLIALLLVSKRLAIGSVKTAIRVVSLLSSIIVIFRNKEFVYQLAYKFLNETVPYLFSQLWLFLSMVYQYAVSYSEQVFNGFLR